MKLAELFERRLILLSGKGGVGKTTIAVLLSLLAARYKKRVLLVEMSSTERVAPFFGLKEIGHKEIPLSPYITGINLNPRDCFEEYVLMQIRFKKLFDTFVNNRFVTYFINAVPGLNDLLMIGKIFDLERQKKGFTKKEYAYDLIVVDGPATGHGASAFEVPLVVKRAVRVGPLKKQSENLLALLQNEEKTIFCPVTLAEEMPTVETAQLVSHIKTKLDIQLGPIFLNNYHSTPITHAEEQKIEADFPEPDDNLFPYFAYSLLAVRRARLNQFYDQELQKINLEHEMIRVPHLSNYQTNVEYLKPLLELLDSNYY